MKTIDSTTTAPVELPPHEARAAKARAEAQAARDVAAAKEEEARSILNDEAQRLHATKTAVFVYEEKRVQMFKALAMLSEFNRQAADSKELLRRNVVSGAEIGWVYQLADQPSFRAEEFARRTAAIVEDLKAELDPLKAAVLAIIERDGTQELLPRSLKGGNTWSDVVKQSS